MYMSLPVLYWFHFVLLEIERAWALLCVSVVVVRRGPLHRGNLTTSERARRLGLTGVTIECISGIECDICSVNKNKWNSHPSMAIFLPHCLVWCFASWYCLFMVDVLQHWWGKSGKRPCGTVSIMIITLLPGLNYMGVQSSSFFRMMIFDSSTSCDRRGISFTSAKSMPLSG